MKSKNSFQLLAVSLLVVFLGLFIGCSDDGGGNPTPIPAPKQHAPTAPKLKMPENKAKISSGEDIKLMWEASTDEDKDAVKYNVYLSEKDKSNLELLKSGITSTFYTIEKTLPEGTYQWKIEATDGKHKTSSDLFSFKVEKIYGLALSTDNVYLKVEGTKQINITSGSGNYIVSSNKTNIATADLSGTTINVIGKSEGTAEITVTDTKTNQSKKITVNVKNLVIAKDRVDLKVGGEASINIASGSESYSVSSDKPDVAMVELSGTEVKITGKSKGTAIITVTDNLTEETKEITVKVNSLEISKTEVSIGIGKTAKVEITSGSGDYSVSIDKSEIAMTEVSGTEVKITGKSKGIAIITITDNLTKETKQITTKVNIFELSKTNLTLTEGKRAIVRITSGSGDYGLSVFKNKDVVTAHLDGSEIEITGEIPGSTEVNVFDNTWRVIKKINVTVEPSNSTRIKDVTYKVSSITSEGVTKPGKLTDVKIKIPYTKGQGNYSAVTLEQNTAPGYEGDVNKLKLSIPSGTFNGEGEIIATLHVDGDGVYQVKPTELGDSYLIARFSVTLGDVQFRVNIEAQGVKEVIYPDTKK